MVAIVAVFLALGGRVCAAEELAPLPIKLPIPPFYSGPAGYTNNPHFEKARERPRPPFMAPKGATNLAVGRPVSSSNPQPLHGILAEITDGNNQSGGPTNVVLRGGAQWVQIDLESIRRIYAIVIWRDFQQEIAYYSVVVQVADDADFVKNVRTLFNNDYENRLGFGAGTNLVYYEAFDGKLIDAKGVAARYVRLYSRGSTRFDDNRYTEVEVYGL